MSKTAGSSERKKSFESNFAEEVRRLVKPMKMAVEVAESAAHQENAEKNQGIPGAIIDAARVKYALKIDEFDPAHGLLRDTFALCALDPNNPWHWRILLQATTEVAFKRSGAYEKWDEGAFFELSMDIQELKRLEPSATTDEKVAALLKKREPFKSKYTMKLGYLRKLVGKARDQRFNVMAGYNEEDDFLEFLAARRRERSNVSAEMAASILEKGVQDQIEESLNKFKSMWESSGRVWSEATREEMRPPISEMVRSQFAGKNAK
jgi:hypothetical protein